jgi:hypothetical protein
LIFSPLSLPLLSSSSAAENLNVVASFWFFGKTFYCGKEIECGCACVGALCKCGV